MFKELFKRWFGKPETKVQKSNKPKIYKFESVEEGREFISKIKGKKTHIQIANYLNKNGYRTVRGLKFTKRMINYYLLDDFTLEYTRYNSRVNKSKKGVPA